MAVFKNTVRGMNQLGMNTINYMKKEHEICSKETL